MQRPSSISTSRRLSFLAAGILLFLLSSLLFSWNSEKPARPSPCPALKVEWSSTTNIDGTILLKDDLPASLKFTNIREMAITSVDGPFNASEFRCLQIDKWGLFATVMQIFAVHNWNNFYFGKYTCISGKTPYFKNGETYLSYNALFPTLITSEEFSSGEYTGKFLSAEVGIHDCNNLYKLVDDIVQPLGAFRLYQLYLNNLESTLSHEYHLISDRIDAELVKLGMGKNYIAVHVRRGDSVVAKMRGNSIKFSVNEWIRRIIVGVRLVNADSILLMSDDTQYEAEICEKLSATFPDKVCIEITRHFLSVPDVRVAAEYINLSDEGFRLWKLAKVFAASHLMVGTFSSNFERVVQLWRNDPFERMYDVNGWHWQPCWHGANPLNYGKPILETVPPWNDK